MPKEIVHGQSGYRRGCRCGECRAAHAAANAAWRAAKKAPKAAKEREPLAPMVKAPAPAAGEAGPLEAALTADLAELVGEPPWKRTLAAAALMNARILDQVPMTERYDVVSGLQLRTLEMLDRLRKVDGAGGGVPAGWFESLAQAD